MKMKDYNSTDAALRAQYLDRWHAFSKIEDVARVNQGYKGQRLTLQTTTGSLLSSGTGSYNNNGTGTAHLTLTSSGTSTSSLASVAVGDVVYTAAGTSNSVYLQVIAISPPPGGEPLTVAANTVITFDKLVRDVNSSSVWGSTQITAQDVTGEMTIYQSQLADVSSTVMKPVKTLDTLTIKAHGIPIYNNFASQFYNAYVPYHYGGPNVRAPADIGALMVPFCLYPGFLIWSRICAQFEHLVNLTYFKVN